MGSLPELTPRQAQAAVERAGASMALTSGAGCGKTLVLARRYATLLLTGPGGEADPFDGLVALTFTDKAAVEMLQRVRAVLLDRLARLEDPRQRERLAHWVTELPAARVSTIHSFCAALLRRYAIEAGVDPNFAVCADQLVAAQMLEASVQAAVLAAVERQEPDVLELLARTDLDRVIREVRGLLERRIDWMDQDYSDPKATLARWRELQRQVRLCRLRALAADGKLRDELEYLSAYPCTEPDDKLDAYRQEKLAVIREMLGRPAEEVTVEDVGCLKDKPGNKGRAAAWGGKGAMLAYRRRLVAFLEQFGALAAWFAEFGQSDTAAAEYLATLTRLARQAEELYSATKRTEGLLDFDDLIVLTRRLLREVPAVRDALRRQLRQLLIDEGQDTDANQLEMLWGLVADGETPPPGKVFIVGDLKQSIYRFRGARAEVFARLCERFGRDRLALERCFRMHQAGVAFINHVFGQLMQRYEPIASARREVPPGPSVEVLLAEPEAPDAESAGVAQADLTAQRIEEMIGREELVYDAEAGRWRPVRPGDVAILFARMTRSLEYERALRERNVRYYVVAGTGFFKQQEVYDILNALQAIDNPLNDVALMGVLRSALFGLDDNALLHIASAVKPPYFHSLTTPAVLNRLSEPQRSQLNFAHGLIARLHRVKDALGPAGVIERLLEQTGYEGVLLSQFGGRRKLGNVYRLLAAARSAHLAGDLSLADFVRRYDELVMAEVRYEQAAVAAEAEDVVRIMTIHKAKGLEFPVVFIPDLNARARGPGGGVLFRHDWGLTCKPPRVPGREDEDGGSPVSHELALQMEKDELGAEDVRKLYVAATRHRDYLVLVGADVRSKKSGRFESSSHLAALDDVLGITRALDAGQETISYGPDGSFTAVLSRKRPRPARRSRRRRPIGQLVLAQAGNGREVAARLVEAGRRDSRRPGPLVGPLVGTGAPAGSIGATALADFEHCPMLYRWRHELRVPVEAAAGPGRSRAALDAATAGIVFHRCMELLDLEADDLPAQAEALVCRVFAELELPAEPAAVVGQLRQMLGRFAGSPLCKMLRQARQRLNELSFVMRTDAMELTGQIDLLFQDARGGWHVVDYKSDRIGPEEVESRGRRYELQMMIYLAAARRHLGESLRGARVYFLRPAAEWVLSAGRTAGLSERLAALAEALVRSRRTGRYRRRGDDQCRRCSYGGLCQCTSPV